MGTVKLFFIGFKYLSLLASSLWTCWCQLGFAFFPSETFSMFMMKSLSLLGLIALPYASSNLVGSECYSGESVTEGLDLFDNKVSVSGRVKN